MRKGFLPLTNVGRTHLPRERSEGQSSPGVESRSFPIPNQFSYWSSWGNHLSAPPRISIYCFRFPFCNTDCSFACKNRNHFVKFKLVLFKLVRWYSCSQVTCNSLWAMYLHNKGLRIQQHVFCCCLVLHSAYHCTELLMSLFLNWIFLHKLDFKTA